MKNKKIVRRCRECGASVGEAGPFTKRRCKNCDRKMCGPKTQEVKIS